jgi:flagellin
MTLNSINTNSNAFIALESLNDTSAALSATQKAISTGFRVADASDDGASFAIAQKVRSDVSGLTTVTQQLGNAQGLVGVATTALTSVSTDFASAKSLLTDIADSTTSSDQRSQDLTSFQNLVSLVANAVDGAVYNNQTLLGNNVTGTTTTAPTAGFSVVTDENGSSTTIQSQDVVGGTDNTSGTSLNVAQTLASFAGLTFSRTQDATSGVVTDTFTGQDASAGGAAFTAAQTALAATTGATSFSAALSQVDTSLNALGSDTNFINATITFTNDKIDSLNNGLGSLIDADLTKESALLQSLQIKQQLGTQALSIANQSPQSLLSLFR